MTHVELLGMRPPLPANLHQLVLILAPDAALMASLERVGKDPIHLVWARNETLYDGIIRDEADHGWEVRGEGVRDQSRACSRMTMM